MMKRNLMALALVAGLSACGAAEGGGAGELTDRTNYPSEGLGLTPGSILEKHAFQAPDGSTWDFDKDVFKNPKNRVMLLTTTAGWCGACIDEQPKLKAMHEKLSSKGLIIVAALFEDSESQPATLDQTRAWRDQYKLPYSIVLDQPFVLSKYYDESATPMNMVVDVDTMEILDIVVGSNMQAVRAVIEDNLDL